MKLYNAFVDFVEQEGLWPVIATIIGGSGVFFWFLVLISIVT